MPDILARAPTRIDFGGGWTDVPPYSTEQGGVVCNLAIARYATVRLVDSRPRDDTERLGGESALAMAALRRFGAQSVRLWLDSDYPTGAGLGGSSAAGVAAVGALAAWRGETLHRGELAERSRAIEVEDLGIAGGRQDHYAAAFGGALELRFGESTEVNAIPLTEDLRHELERRCIVLFTGQSRISGETITAVLDAYRRGDAGVCNALLAMKHLAEGMVAALTTGRIDELGGLVGEHWEHQRSLHPAITTERIDEIMRRARAAGALGGKALGASGGGCVLLIAPRDGTERVRGAVSALGEPLGFSIDTQGFGVLAGV